MIRFIPGDPDLQQRIGYGENNRTYEQPDHAKGDKPAENPRKYQDQRQISLFLDKYRPYEIVNGTNDYSADDHRRTLEGLTLPKQPDHARDKNKGRADLGNTQPGDGAKFKGRGLIQITGRANYKACGAALGLDLETSPALLEQSENAAMSAAWFWNSRHLNAVADAGDVVKATKLINGGNIGLQERTELYEEALEIFG
jgi:hypothetical protein